MGLKVHFTKKAAILAFGTAMLAATSVFAEPDPNFHIYIAYGQSNMDGNAMYEDQDTKEHSRYKMFATTNCGTSRVRGTVYPAVPPMFHCPNNTNGLSVADWFGRKLADAMPNITVGIIPVAIPGTSIKLFQPSEYAAYLAGLKDDEQWLKNSAKTFDENGNAMKAILDMAKEAQKVGVIKGIIFHQGETDAGMQDWETRVASTYNTIITELKLDASKVPFIAGEMVPVNDYMRGRVRGLKNYISNFGYASSEGLSDRGDNLHFDAASYRTMGARYAEAMLSLIDVEETEPVKQAPFSGTAATIPGVIQAEDFDIPGTGTGNDSYYDTGMSSNEACIQTDAAKNEAECSTYRDGTGVDIKKSSTGGNVIGWFAKDEWLEYTVNVTKAGTYTLYVAGASYSGGKVQFYLADNGKEIEKLTEEIEIKAAQKPADGDKENYDEYQKTEGVDVVLTQGEHIIRMVCKQQWVDIDFFNLVFGSGAPDDNQIVDATSSSTESSASTASSSESNEDIAAGSSNSENSNTSSTSVANGSSSSTGSSAIYMSNHFSVAFADYKVFDMLGKCLGNVKLNGTNVKQALKQAGFKPGIYMLRNKNNKMIINTTR